jgi:hypothetical protein
MHIEKVKFLDIGIPTAFTGNTYTRECVQKAIKALEKHPQIFGEFGQSDRRTFIDLNKIVVATRNHHIDQDAAYCNLEFLDTSSESKKYQEMFNEGMVSLGIRGLTANMDANKVVHHLDIIAIDLVTN